MMEPIMTRSMKELQKYLRKVGQIPRGAVPFNEEYYEVLINRLFRVSRTVNTYSPRRPAVLMFVLILAGLHCFL